MVLRPTFEEPEDRVVFLARMLPVTLYIHSPLVNTNYNNYDNRGASAPNPMIQLTTAYSLYQSRGSINNFGGLKVWF